MLDNLQKIPTAVEDNMANNGKILLPMEILADAKVEAATHHTHKEEKLQQKSNKTKSILNWLKSTTANNTANQRNNSDINSCQRHNQFDKAATATATQPQIAIDLAHVETSDACATDECTCALLKQQQQQIGIHHSNNNNSTLIATSPHTDDTLRDFRGVQTLRHLWNKRITANKESALRAKLCKQQQQQQHFTKSQSCLLTSATQIEGETPSSTPLDQGFQRRKLRAQSLHDCSQDFGDDVDLTALEIQKHLQKDNFYKYKTAEQASKLRELSEHSATRRFSVGLQWLKRPDIFAKRKMMAATNDAMAADQIFHSFDSDMAPPGDIVINDSDSHMPRASCQQADDQLSQSTAASTPPPTNSPQQLLSPKRTRSATLPSNNDTGVSRNSSTTSLATSSGRPAVRRNSTTRKYSFKTHARTYNARRKMHGATAKDIASSASSSSASASYVGASQSSLVAKLTQQFNESIQNNNSLLEKIKRNNGILMTHKGHVYKVVETGKATLAKTSSKPTNRGEDSARNSVAKNSSAVQKTIEIFESASRGNEKPQIPLKTLKVLKKSKQSVTTKVGIPINPSRLKSVATIKQEINAQNETKPPQTLSLHSTLEMVKEETKTPIGEKDISIGTTLESFYINNEMLGKERPTPSPAIQQLEGQEKKEEEEIEELSIATPLEDRDYFFEEIHKEERDSQTEKLEFRSSELYRKLKRDASISVDHSQPDIIVYINEGNSSNRESFNSTHKENLSRNNSQRRSEEKPPPLKVELAQEVREDKPQINQPVNGNEMIYSEIQEGDFKEKLAGKPNKKESKKKNSPKRSETEKDEEPEEGRKLKSKSTFYEKLKFFTLPRKSQQSTPEPQATPAKLADQQHEEPLTTSGKTEEPLHFEIDVQVLQNYTPMSSPEPKQRSSSEDMLYSSMYDPESKQLLDSLLQQVDEKIQNLTKTEKGTERQLEPEPEPHQVKQEQQIVENVGVVKLVLETPDDYGLHLKPNSSFLHQSYAKVLTKPTELIQAVNVTLVNAIEGEQMIMEQKEIQQHSAVASASTTAEEKQTPPCPKEQLYPSRQAPKIPEEPLYEPIDFEEPQHNPKTEYKIQESSFKEEEDIYQTVEEIQREIYMKRKIEEAKTLAIASDQLLDDYEVIADPNRTPLTLNCNLSIPKKSPDNDGFDGYEEYSPSVMLSSTPVTPASASLGIRKTTDELPDLPEPKRIMNKSPPTKRTPAKPLAATQEPPVTAVAAPAIAAMESHYYTGEEENIYDTIKGSDCYESLQPAGNNNNPNKLEKSSSASTKNSDAVSLSNCYESIAHFKPTRPPSHHSAGSSHGSTLTISSENKTNSLYEDSLATSLRYSSKRIYRRNTETHIEHIAQQAAKVNSSTVSIYNSSLGRASDISDEWTDVSDNEGDAEEPKLQFQIVCEKAHKSPDWSRRVRGKRLHHHHHHQRKSSSYIDDDDPDHYYEQLSPGALNKRHSLGLQERTGSLQRNENMVRVSKRGKKIFNSAHALGQHISDDSFDSDTDDYYESEHFKNAQNDSGVDIRTSKLPDPPASSNQMYSFVKKFKNFLANKKSPNSSKHGGSQQKIDDAGSQFYVNANFQGGGSPGELAKSSLQVPQTKELSTSEKNLIMAQSNVTKAEQQLTTSTTPRKSKAGKSLRHRIRKSLVGFDNKQLATLTPTRSTFYVEEPAHPADDVNGQLDSGFSEKVPGGDPSVGTSDTPDTHKYLTARKVKKESKLTNAQRRRNTISIRPIEPPPPPPDNNGNMKRQSNTSWYAECGVFKNGTTNLVHDDIQLMNGQNDSGNNTASGASWYEEAGLYQTSGVSVASSSGSSGVSTSNEAGPADEMSHSLFSNEPLYQIYSAAKLEAISRDMQDESSTDGYEEIGERRRSAMAESEARRKSSRPTALQLVEPKSGPERTLWSQIPEVVNSMIIPTLTPRERALMEAKFEIITSEASYLKSLNLLRNHYMNHPVFRDQNLVNSRDRKSLFANIVPVHECSERLLTELESCWQDNIMLIGLSKRIYAIAEKHFHVYIGFCEHQGRMDRTLKRLRAGKGLFSQNLELLESSPLCCGLNLHSFLMLPMQRITRLPLLIDAVFSKCHPNDDEYENWKMCLAIMNKIVTQCNVAATKSDQAFEIEKISRQLEFNPSAIRPLAIAPAGVLAPGTKPRFLVKKGEFTHLVWRGDDAKLTFGKKFSKTVIYAFLFSDLLVLTRRKGEEQFSVFDYCPRNMLTITSGDSLPQVPTKDLNSQTSKNLILMTLLENHQRKTSELLLSCPSVSEQERWLQAMRPPESETPGEKLYEQWDCPQVMAKHSYENNEPDGLNLEEGDVVNVTRKLPDGWYKGERIRDGAVGWFPGSYTEEVNSAHVRARNLKLRHRLLTFTATYLESQKRNK